MPTLNQIRKMRATYGDIFENGDLQALQDVVKEEMYHDLKRSRFEKYKDIFETEGAEEMEREVVKDMIMDREIETAMGKHSSTSADQAPATCGAAAENISAELAGLRKELMLIMEGFKIGNGGMDDQVAALNAREKELNARQEEINGRKQELNDRENAVAEREMLVETREFDHEGYVREVEGREALLDSRKVTFEEYKHEQQQELDTKADDLYHEEEELKSWRDDLHAKSPLYQQK
ncbi:hypothetical protein EJ08DRAFT_675481 [Tothia fuscella]|uniref:Uncharacterized protein n=1 Tax=Tothia fuscella TaxID=1048955 RepID=A0A9P4NZ00_9PEZI|nr:hypothetical protein EJ08DRAFT_675481 [Tothia fuscella]